MRATVKLNEEGRSIEFDIVAADKEAENTLLFIQGEIYRFAKMGRENAPQTVRTPVSEIRWLVYALRDGEPLHTIWGQDFVEDFDVERGMSRGDAEKALEKARRTFREEVYFIAPVGISCELLGGEDEDDDD